MEALQTNRKEMGTLVMFHDLEKALAFHKLNTVHILILDESHRESYRKQVEEAQIPAIHKVIIITEHKGIMYEEEIPLYKYQSSQVLVQSIYNTYVASLGDLYSKFLQVKIIGIFSPSNSTYTSIYAERISEIVAREKRTLYVNFELFPCISPNEEGKGTLSDLIYMIATSSKVSANQLTQICEGGDTFDYIYPILHSKDLFSIDSESLEKLFQWFLMQKQYEVICISLDYIFTFTEELFSYCDAIFSPIEDTTQAKRKQDVFLNMLQMEQKTNVIEKIYPYTVPQGNLNMEEARLQSFLQTVVH